MYNNGSKAKQHIPFNRSVYSACNACNFIPNCAYEKEYMIERMPNGIVLRIYQSDNGKHRRAVLYKTPQDMTGFAGLLYEVKTGRVVYGEVNPADRGQGMYKQLKALVHILTKVKLWSDYQSNDLLTAAGMLNK